MACCLLAAAPYGTAVGKDLPTFPFLFKLEIIELHLSFRLENIDNYLEGEDFSCGRAGAGWKWFAGGKLLAGCEGWEG